MDKTPFVIKYDHYIESLSEKQGCDAAGRKKPPLRKGEVNERSEDGGFVLLR